MKTTKLLIAACLLGLAGVVLAREAANVEKQPVFLVCPHQHGYDAMSVYLEVDKNDKSKVLAVGLENLKGKNSKDSSYDAVLRAQRDPNVRRENLGILNADAFGRGMIEVRQNDAMKIGVTPAGKDLRLYLSMRISLSDRFNIGGKDANKREVLLRYDPGMQEWYACATRLKDTEGREHASSGCERVTGIAFPVSGTGIYRVAIVNDAGDAFVVMDR
jgi:hypothetical protein